MKKIFLLFTPVFILSLLFYSVMMPVEKAGKDICTKVFRMHIIAASDSDEDQFLKLKVRDEVLRKTAPLFEECTCVEDAANISKNHLKEIQMTAQRVLAFYGSDDSVSVATAREYFTTRVYDGFALPSGIYDCLKIVIGRGEGRNWWCVMYPAVCLSGCTEDFGETLDREETEMVTDDRYIVRFKIVEIIDKIKNKRGQP